jgi:hypothetical protein
MAGDRRIDPEILLMKHFSREIEEERNRWASRDPLGAAVERTAGASRQFVAPERPRTRRHAWPQEAATAAILAACAGAALLAAPGCRAASDPGILGERAVSVGILLGAKLARAVSEYADMRDPAPGAFMVPGRIRGKD